MNLLDSPKQLPMKQFVLTFLMYSCLLFSTAGNTTVPEPTLPAIDAYVKHMMQVHGIPGVALAVVHRGQVIHENYYGQASLTHDVPVQEKHLFRVYSTTKLLVSTAVFQLIEKGALSLEDPLERHLPDLPESWRTVQVKHLLTHSSGIPNFIQFDSDLSNEEMWNQLAALDMDFPTGSRFDYNQTNYWLLATIIEQLSGQSMEAFIIDQQFSGNGEGILFSSDSREVIPDRLSKYNYDLESESYSYATDREQSRGLAGNGLNITLDQFLGWSHRLDRGELLRTSTKAAMWTRFEYTDSDDSSLHGWGDYSTRGVKAYGFTGGGVSAFRIYPDHELTIILLTNGYRYMPVHNHMVNEVAGLVDTATFNQPLSLGGTLIEAFIEQDFDQAMVTFRDLKQQHPEESLEMALNQIGYLFLRKQETDRALKIFTLNTREYPNSANTYDSLGEAYLVRGDLDKALRNYKKSLQLDPESPNARKMIEGIERRLGQ